MTSKNEKHLDIFYIPWVLLWHQCQWIPVRELSSFSKSILHKSAMGMPFNKSGLRKRPKAVSTIVLNASKRQWTNGSSEWNMTRQSVNTGAMPNRNSISTCTSWIQTYRATITLMVIKWMAEKLCRVLFYEKLTLKKWYSLKRGTHSRGSYFKLGIILQI